MRIFYYIELFFITLLISCILSGIPKFSLVVVFIGCLYILYKGIQFIDLQKEHHIYRPCCLTYEFYGDSEYRTYYEILENRKTSILVKNILDNSIKKISFPEFVIFSYKIINKP